MNSHHHHHNSIVEEDKVKFIYCSLFLVFFSLFYQWALYFRKNYFLNLIPTAFLLFVYSDYLSNFRIYLGAIVGVGLALVVSYLFNKKQIEYSVDAKKWLFVLVYFLEPFILFQIRYRVIDHTNVYVGGWLWCMAVVLFFAAWKFVSPGKNKNAELQYWSYAPLFVLGVWSGFLGKYDWIAFVIFIPTTIAIYYLEKLFVPQIKKT
jgi:hypothetical protein